ncbi:MAG: hypothetical protein WC926_04960 [Candidatus Paceibacterota bacterium]|jgi:hypothetical protein
MAGWTEAFRIFKWIDNARKKGADKNERDAAKASMSGKRGEPVIGSMLKRLFGKQK